MDHDGIEVEVSGLSWGVNGRTILRHIDMTVRRGEFLMLVGPNGSGKSSLLRCLYRFHRPSAGSVRVRGSDIWRMTARRVAQIVAVVTQESPEGFQFSVGEIVTLGRVPHLRGISGLGQHDRYMIRNALEAVGCWNLAERNFDTLSGGEKQRVLIARAIAQEPEILILDEPTNNLDVRHQFDLLELLRALPQTKIAAIHDLNLAASYGSHVSVMSKGSIVASGSTWETLTPELIAEVFGVEATAHHDRGGMALLLRPTKAGREVGT